MSFVLFWTSSPYSVTCILGSLTGTLSRQSTKPGYQEYSGLAKKKKAPLIKKMEAGLLHLLSWGDRKNPSWISLVWIVWHWVEGLAALPSCWTENAGWDWKNPHLERLVLYLQKVGQHTSDRSAWSPETWSIFIESSLELVTLTSHVWPSY